MPSLVLSSNFSQSSYTVTGAIDRVLGDLGLRNGNFCTSGDVLAWLNEGQMILAREAKCFHVVTTSGTTSGTAEYPLPNEATARCIAIQEVLYDGVPLRFLTIQQLQAHNRDWRTAGCSTPWAYYMRDFSAIGLYPTPDTTDPDILTIVETALPPDATATEEFFSIPHGCEDAHICYAKLCASMKDAYGEGRDRIPIYQKQWERGLERATATAKSVSENQVVRIGENALLENTWQSPFWINPETLATSL